ncbi:MAG: alkaline phosphatase family protein [Muribaculaceae bacterium]
MAKRRRKQQVNRLVTGIVASMVAISSMSQIKDGRTQLVIGIVVDQLRSDYIELLQNRFSQRGFNRLMREGAYFENVDFNGANLDIASGTALIMTGAYGNANGIAQKSVFNHASKTTAPVLADSKYIGNFTTETYSPLALKVSTIADEVRVNNDGLGMVHAIAPDAQQAILLGGHAANSVFWIDDVNGKWATTTFFKEVPSPVQSRNYNYPLANRLNTMAWEPALALEAYDEIPQAHRFYRFRYNFPDNSKDRYRSFKQSALVNEEITSVAIDYINTMKLGNRGQLDMLNIGYTAAPFEYSKTADNRFELHDTYIRLDAQIERLLDAVDKAVGMSNVVVFLTSTGYFCDDLPVDAKYNIPSGEFRPDRAISLLNMYLMAIYGNGQWVDGYYNRNFYLNHALIKDQKIDLSEIRAKSSEFLRQMSGVTAAYTYEEILNNPVNTSLVALHRMMVPAYQGDVEITVSAGWTIVETQNAEQKVKHVRSNAMSAPAFILAPSVKAQRITSAIDAAFLAPTVSRILRIRSPNAAAFMPVLLQ